MPAKRTGASDTDQLALFAQPSDVTIPGKNKVEIGTHVDARAKEVAKTLPSWVRLGTSSWTFPGWGGIVYEGDPSQADLIACGLRAYARHPLLRTAGIDRSFYGPLDDRALTEYADALPAGYPLVSKVWEELTTIAFPDHARYGARAGTKNPAFLDASRVREEVLAPYARVFRDHAGPFVFEIPPAPRAMLPVPDAFAEAIDRLLTNLPNDFRYAFEVRNPELLTRPYFDVLAAHDASHVFNHWTAMPPIGEQLAIPWSLGASFVVARLMLPPFARYEEKKAEWAPFNRIAARDEGMRRDVIHLLHAARAAGAREAFVLVNNKAEGSAPLTAFELAERIATELPEPRAKRDTKPDS